MARDTEDGGFWRAMAGAGVAILAVLGAIGHWGSRAGPVVRQMEKLGAFRDKGMPEDPNRPGRFAPFAVPAPTRPGTALDATQPVAAEGARFLPPAQLSSQTPLEVQAPGIAPSRARFPRHVPVEELLPTVMVDGRPLFADAARRIVDPAVLDKLEDPAMVRRRIAEYEDPDHATIPGDWLLGELAHLPLRR